MALRGPEEGLDRTLARACRGEGDAWRVIVESYSRRVFGLVVKQCGDRELAEEITQATFVQVVGHIGKYRERGKFEPWLFRIAMNLLRDEMRRRGRQARPVGGSSAGSGDEDNGQWAVIEDKIAVGSPGARKGGDDPLELVSRAEQVERLKKAVEQLGESDREILHLRHTAELSFAQIAETLNEPLGTVLARAHRALGKLRKILEDEGNDELNRQDAKDAKDAKKR